MCRVVATFSERRSIVAESLPIDRQRGAVSEPFEMIAARDAADEVELIAETEPTSAVRHRHGPPQKIKGLCRNENFRHNL